MVAYFALYTNFMVVLALACSVQTLSISKRDPLPTKYIAAHPLGVSYLFHSRDGWTTYNASNSPSRSDSDEEMDSGLVKRSGKADKKLKWNKKPKGSKKLKVKTGQARIFEGLFT
ncbi:uncharacterized protein BT62DRAFT_929232 [Guyanagaster necrorhizus]|uniref:Uncharacterized protein n=1 Tax=Guyanagaster necrorhizus TaxID=856835 RepID=A0A9P7VZ59_9AGAR|nr:uncharacterized protein BT62DRAFT_929232 [Guyanagaster necrorhizus MCA 3950]KAG7449258.1 hypothetical protein BT62DRAFT_929232 [Guyanagaster necrorhizus MCA 3950]